MSFRNVSRRCAARRSSFGFLRRRRALVEQLESRQLLAADVGFVETLPTAQEAQFGSVVLTDEGREVCLAFMAVGTAEGEDPVESLDDPGPVDLSAVIVQPAGPLAPGAAFTSEITFENAGPNDAIATDLGVTFDANLTGITWEREIIRAQPATVAVADLDGFNGLALQGIEAIDFAGFAVSGGGDFNNDGIDDFIIGASEPDVATTAQDGDAYVVFGTTGGFPPNIALDSLDGTNGFSFLGFGAGGNTGTSVDNAGDVNGDGIEDLIVGAPGADPGGVNDAGEAYVIFGRATFPSQITAGTMGESDGFKIFGAGEEFGLGGSVAGAGDVNGDGLDDLIVGASGKRVPDVTAPGFTVSQGTSYVIFGQQEVVPGTSPFGASINVGGLTGVNGFEIGTSDTLVNLGYSVDGAGDINNDGFNDLILGAPGGVNDPGQSKVYVVYGRSDASVPFAPFLDVTALPVEENGFAITAPRSGHVFGASVAGVGDVNNDGFDDFITSDASGSTNAGRAYLVFGSGTVFPTPLDISSLDGTGGFIIEGPSANHPASVTVAGAGDVNGDGVVDLLIGQPAATVDSTDFPGGGYVVFGSDTGFTSPFNLSTLNGSNGFLIEGRNTTGQAGSAISAAGDVNGDGLADVIVGARFESPGGNTLAGETYVVFGRGSTTTSGSGAISQTLDLFPGDKVIYRVSATIAPAATVSTIVNATTAVGPGVSDTNAANDSDSATTLIAAPAGPIVQSIRIDDGPGDVVLGGWDVVPGDYFTNVALDRIYVQFDAPVLNFNASNVKLYGVTLADYAGVMSFGYNAVENVGIIILDNSLVSERLRIQLLDGITDANGVALNGDNDDQTVGGVFDRSFDVLVGDGNRDGFVNGGDIPPLGALFGQSIGLPGYDRIVDYNGDGFINGGDIPTLGASFGNILPSGTPAVPAPPAAGQGSADDPSDADVVFGELGLLGNLALDL